MSDDDPFAVYRRTMEAGEDVRMDYDADGTQLGRELLEDVDPAP